MAYLQLGSIDPSNFNSTKYPGICKPSNTTTLAAFKNLQAQLNRVAQAIGASKVTVDGDLGPGTLSLLSAVAANLSQGGVSVDPARNILIQAGAYSCVDAAQNADTLGNAAQGVADQMGVSSKISQPSGGSSLVSATGIESRVTTPTPASASIVDALGLSGMDSTTMLLLLGGLGAVVYFTGPKKGRRATATSRRR